MAGRTFLLVLTGALLGGGVTALLGSALTPAPEAAPADTSALEERITQLESRMAQAERTKRSARRERRKEAGTAKAAAAAESASETDSSGPLPSGPVDDLGLPVPEEEFVTRVAAALTEIEKRRAERKQREQLIGRRDGYLAEVKKRYTNYKGPLALTDEELGRIQTVAETYVDERLLLQADGHAQEELLARDRKARRDIRDIMGPDRYRKLRALELDRAARPVIVDAAGKAGVDSEQRKQIERLLSDHIERIVDSDVRVRTEGFDLALLALSEEAKADNLAVTAPALDRNAMPKWEEMGYFALITVAFVVLYVALILGVILLGFGLGGL